MDNDDQSLPPLPPLPPIVGAPWLASTVEQYARNYALRCIATREAENARSYWCFHCKQVFTDENLAKEHFGASTETMTRCMADLEKGIIGGPHVPFVRWGRYEKEFDRAEAAQSQAAAMARLLEQCRDFFRSTNIYTPFALMCFAAKADKIDAALAAWKGNTK